MVRRFRSGLIKTQHARENDALRIVADAAIAHPGIGEGRLIPLVILDTKNRPDLEEFIRVHQFISAGDVNSQWGQMEGHENTVALILSFVRPSEIVAIIEFDLDRNHGILVEQVLATKALYIQAGREGDRLKHNPDLPKVILEVPEVGFGNHWDSIYLRHTVATFRKRGMPRADAKRAARMAVNETRKIATLRVPIR